MEEGQDRLSCDGFDAWIVVDGAPVPQYSIECVEGEQKVSCWIPSTMDKEFSISFRGKPKEKYAYSAMVLLDGHEVVHHMYRNDRPGLVEASAINVVSAIRTSATEIRNFAFASLEMTDDDMHLENPSAQHIGDITVVIQRRTNLVTSIVQGPGTYSDPLSNGKVHERSKKGLAHQIKLGSVKKEALNPRRITYRSELYGKPITFVFKYRPLAMLQATGIVPRVPTATEKESPQRPIATTDNANKRKASVVKTESDNDEDDSDEDEDDEDDLAKERELLAELERVRNKKRTKREGNARSKKKVKTEPKTYFTPGEVIDLT